MRHLLMTVRQVFSAGLVVLLVSGGALNGAEGNSEASILAPIELTREQDHQRTLSLLGIEKLRRGANGRDTSAPNYANYDESKANPYPSLPKLMLTNDREAVTTPESWWTVRRPEIVELFDREVYGRVPVELPGVSWEVVKTEEAKEGETVVKRRELIGHVDNSSYPAINVDIQVSLIIPADAVGEVPVITQFGFNFSGRRFGRRPAPPGPSWKEQILAAGWGIAVLSPNSVQADNGAGLTKGIIGLVNNGQPRSVDDWGSLRAWAWGASRLLDYFETEDWVDAARVGIQGHSRYGKAAAVAMAYEPRLAIGFLSSSGAGGVKLHRRDWGERVENVAGTSEYHWMAGNYMKYAGSLTWDDLPVDSHQLIALCAPRPVFISSGDKGDGWVDAKGMFLAGAYASPVYELLGKKGTGTLDFPPVETGLMDGDVTFRQHSGGHTAGPNWPYFIDFAKRYLE
jgi:hypothetical protein